MERNDLTLEEVTEHNRVVSEATTEECKVTHVPGSVFEELGLKGESTPCLRHWDFPPEVLCGVEHCGFCGAVLSSVEGQVEQWFKCKVALGLVPENHLQMVEQCKGFENE